MQRKQGIYEKYVKRILDVLFSMLFLILFWWLILVIALLVKIKLGSPVIFKQPRPGKNEKIFNMYKFRTMTDEKDSNGELLPDEMRLTSFGIFLRRTSCDELLEIFNILKGDISIVGPRPIVQKETEIYGKDIAKLLSVKPGLTGYWQAYARNNATYASGERQKMEMYYVEHQSLWLDIKILFKTVESVFKQEGAQ